MANNSIRLKRKDNQTATETKVRETAKAGEERDVY